ncbi:hypothetical protein L6164_017546 [Bauhinia variegata]|uniref:Uncharacterized protein n=1 Tax=Bauhinia variegata TaxID=167791 RepID=A0ACB9N909_BAUVA|nr:hypothetical protein L6164_017546 [Bauhinia variegata]
MIGDWYTQSHTALRTALDAGKDLGMPDGVLINGKGPFRYNTTLVPDGIEYESFNVDPGKTYRIRVHNVGLSTTLNFRIQSHNLLLAETEGHYTIQSNYKQFDIHVGQSYSFLVTMDQNASSDYYVVASARFVNESLWQRVTGVAILHYSNSKGPAAGPLPPPPDDIYIYDKEASMNQARSVRQNTSASGARPNPQGSFHYGQINITDTYLLKVVPPVTINGKARAAINGISFVKPETPFRLVDQNKLRGIYKLDFPSEPFNRPPVIDISLINATYKGFIEIVLQNNDTTMQTFHMDGYYAFVVGYGYGNWSEDSRNSYNKIIVFRSLPWIEMMLNMLFSLPNIMMVYPGAWTAILISLDNAGIWNLRSENLDRWYLGQETYLRVVNPEENGETEMAAPDNVLYCGALKGLQREQHHFNSAASIFGGGFNVFTLLLALFTPIFISR